MKYRFPTAKDNHFENAIDFVSERFLCKWPHLDDDRYAGQAPVRSKCVSFAIYFAQCKAFREQGDKQRGCPMMMDAISKLTWPIATWSDKFPSKQWKPFWVVTKHTCACGQRASGQYRLPLINGRTFWSTEYIYWPNSEREKKKAEKRGRHEEREKENSEVHWGPAR